MCVSVHPLQNLYIANHILFQVMKVAGGAPLYTIVVNMTWHVIERIL